MEHTKASITGRAARLALSFVLACGLMLPTAALMARPDQAWAANADIDIVNIADNDNTYQAWLVFKADIDENDYAQHIAWSETENVETTVLTYLDANGYPAWLKEVKSLTSSDNTSSYSNKEKATHKDPQNAAEFISYKVYQSDKDTDFGQTEGTYKKMDSDDTLKIQYEDNGYSRLGTTFSFGLAKALADANIGTTATAEPSNGTAKFQNLAEGFYLISTVSSTIGSDEAGTAPIWVPVGGSASTITEKSALVKMGKKVSTDQASNGSGVATVAWGKAADANTGQDLWYRLDGTLPANIKSFPSYHYKFTDTLNEGMVLAGNNTNSVKVVAYPSTAAMEADTTSASFGTGGVDITSNATIAYTGDVLTVDIVNLLTVDLGSGAGVTKNHVIAVYYQAHVDAPNADAVYGEGTGGNGNQNTAKLTYTGDPLALTDVDTTAENTSTYSYQVKLVKRDKSNGEPLGGAGFIVQVDATGNTDDLSKGHYVKTDGTIGKETAPVSTDSDYSDYLFTSASDESSKAPDGTTALEKGEIRIQGLDEGKYVLKEVKTPELGSGDTRVKYDSQGSDITLTITSDLNQTNGQISSFSAAVTGGEDASVNDDLMMTRLGRYDLENRKHYLDGSADDTLKNATNVNGNAIDATTSMFDKTSGLITMMTVDDRAILMPLTGLPGYIGLVILGLALVGCGFGGLLALRRMRAKKANQ